MTILGVIVQEPLKGLSVRREEAFLKQVNGTENMKMFRQDSQAVFFIRKSLGRTILVPQK